MDFIIAVTKTTIGQIVETAGMVFLFGAMLFVLSKLTRNVFRNAHLAALDRYLTGWIGTPVHELSHAVFCVLFRHTITDIKMFAVDPRDGVLGYVTHTYNRKSLYQQAGNFFIGVGPVIAGCCVLSALMWLLVPNHHDVAILFTNGAINKVTLATLPGDYPLMLSFSFDVFGTIFSPHNFSSPGFWVFLYLSLCVSSHMGLSPSDLKGMWGGLLVIAAVLLTINAVLLFFHFCETGVQQRVNEYVSGFIGVSFSAVIISIGNFLFTYTILGILHFIKYRSVLHLT